MSIDTFKVFFWHIQSFILIFYEHPTINWEYTIALYNISKIIAGKMQYVDFFLPPIFFILFFTPMECEIHLFLALQITVGALHSLLTVNGVLHKELQKAILRG